MKKVKVLALLFKSFKYMKLKTLPFTMLFFLSLSMACSGQSKKGKEEEKAPSTTSDAIEEEKTEDEDDEVVIKYPDGKEVTINGCSPNEFLKDRGKKRSLIFLTVRKIFDEPETDADREIFSNRVRDYILPPFQGKALIPTKDDSGKYKYIIDPDKNYFNDILLFNFKKDEGFVPGQYITNFEYALDWALRKKLHEEEIFSGILSEEEKESMRQEGLDEANGNEDLAYINYMPQKTNEDFAIALGHALFTYDWAKDTEGMQKKLDGYLEQYKKQQAGSNPKLLRHFIEYLQAPENLGPAKAPGKILKK